MVASKKQTCCFSSKSKWFIGAWRETDYFPGYLCRGSASISLGTWQRSIAKGTRFASPFEPEFKDRLKLVVWFQGGPDTCSSWTSTWPHRMAYPGSGSAVCEFNFSNRLNSGVEAGEEKEKIDKYHGRHSSTYSLDWRNLPAAPTQLSPLACW